MKIDQKYEKKVVKIMKILIQSHRKRVKKIQKNGSTNVEIDQKW